MSEIVTLNGYSLADTTARAGLVALQEKHDDDLKKKLSIDGTAPNAKALGGKAPEYYLQPRNLLDNSDFRNPVNQRGHQNKTYSEWGGYTIDRWLAYANGATLEITNNGITLLNSIYQPISNEIIAKYNGKILTFAVKINGAIYTATGTVNQIGSWNNIARADTPYGYIQIETENNNEMFCIINNNINAALLEWACLYEGQYTVDILPPYMPKGYAVEALSCGVPMHPQNLLDNSDFTNPVNQRGVNNTTEWQYCIDRWVARTSNMSLQPTNNGLAIASANADSYIYQKIANPEKLLGKKCTAAVCDGNGNIAVAAFTFPNSIPTAWTRIADTSVGNTWLYIFGSNSLSVGVGVVGTKDETTIKWVALYEGSYTVETLPPYVPKGYANELIACNVAEHNDLTANNSLKLGGKAPEYYLQPRNLLDNSDFRNPVNQRGKTSYGAGGYTIDRWRLNSALPMTLNTGYISFNNITSGTLYLEQCIPLEKLETGKTYTVTVKTADGAIKCGSGVLSTTLTAVVSTTAYYVQFNTDTDCGRLQFRVRAGFAVDVVWIALYEGSYTADTLPPYVPKDYAVELAECQRYYYQYPNDTSVYGYTGSGGTSAYLIFELPAVMRLTNPTVSLGDRIHAAFGGAGALQLTSISSSKIVGKQLQLVMPLPSTQATNTICAGWTSKVIAVSADL